MPQFGGFPQLPFMPFGGGNGSPAGSDYGGHTTMPMPPMGYQNTGSAFGMMPGDPRNTMMTNLNMFGGSSGSQHGGAPSPMGAMQRPMSGYSMATTANLFAGPSMNPNPSDEDLINALRNYLSTQDLMTVTKKWVHLALFVLT
jgi:chitin synthase